MIVVTVDVSELDKSLFIQGKKPKANGKTAVYAKLILWPNIRQTNFGDWRDEQTHMVKQGGNSKDDWEKERDLPIIGNAKEIIYKPQGGNRQAAAENPSCQDKHNEPDENDNVPF